MQAPCPVGIHCPGSDYPATNYSCEEDDPLTYVGICFSGQGAVTNSPTPNGTNPDCQYTDCLNGPGPGVSYQQPLGSSFTTPVPGCFAIGEGTTQQAANVQALQYSQTCGPPQDPATLPTTSQIPVTASRPNSGPGTELYSNQPQTAQCQCPPGYTGSLYTVKAGLYKEPTQALADRYAYELAQGYANQYGFCALNPSGHFCLNEELDPGNLFAINGGKAPFTVSLSSGTWFEIGFTQKVGYSGPPPGISVGMADARDFSFSGTFTQAGVFNFTVTIEDADQQVAHVPVTFWVLGISFFDGSTPAFPGWTGKLPDAYVFEPYSYQLDAEGGDTKEGDTLSEYIFGVVEPQPPGDQFPDFLKLSPSGKLSGTPEIDDFDQTFKFQVEVTDQGGYSCAVELSLKVTCPGNETISLTPSGQLFSYVEIESVFPFTASGGCGQPYIISLANNTTLPEGFTLVHGIGSYWAIEGNASVNQVGDHLFTLQVADAVGQTAQFPMVLTIATAGAIVSASCGDPDKPGLVDTGYAIFYRGWPSPPYRDGANSDQTWANAVEDLQNNLRTHGCLCVPCSIGVDIYGPNSTFHNPNETCAIHVYHPGGAGVGLDAVLQPGATWDPATSYALATGDTLGGPVLFYIGGGASVVLSY